MPCVIFGRISAKKFHYSPTPPPRREKNETDTTTTGGRPHKPERSVRKLRNIMLNFVAPTTTSNLSPPMKLREFEIMFKTLYLPLGMYALRIVKDTDVAEDMVQEAFIKAWQATEAGAEIGNFRGYMYRAVRNECISHLRQQRPAAGLEEVAEVADTDVDTSVRDARIWRAIDALPERCREVFLLSKRDGLSQEEIALEMGISVKTVKNQMTKAYERLRSLLEGGHRPFFLPFL